MFLSSGRFCGNKAPKSLFLVLDDDRLQYLTGAPAGQWPSWRPKATNAVKKMRVAKVQTIQDIILRLSADLCHVGDLPQIYLSSNGLRRFCWRGPSKDAPRLQRALPTSEQRRGRFKLAATSGFGGLFYWIHPPNNDRTLGGSRRHRDPSKFCPLCQSQSQSQRPCPGHVDHLSTFISCHWNGLFRFPWTKSARDFHPNRWYFVPPAPNRLAKGDPPSSRFQPL